VLPGMYAIKRIAWAPDGKRFAALSDGQPGVWHHDTTTLLIANADGSNRRAILVGARDLIEWSPDGRKIALKGGPTAGITIVDVASGKLQRLQTTFDDVGALRWTADSKHLRYSNLRRDGDTSVFRFVIREAGLD